MSHDYKKGRNEIDDYTCSVAVQAQQLAELSFNSFFEFDRTMPFQLVHGLAAPMIDISMLSNDPTPVLSHNRINPFILIVFDVVE